MGRKRFQPLLRCGLPAPRGALSAHCFLEICRGRCRGAGGRKSSWREEEKHVVVNVPPHFLSSLVCVLFPEGLLRLTRPISLHSGVLRWAGVHILALHRGEEKCNFTPFPEYPARGVSEQDDFTNGCRLSATVLGAATCCRVLLFNGRTTSSIPVGAAAGRRAASGSWGSFRVTSQGTQLQGFL